MILTERSPSQSSLGTLSEEQQALMILSISLRVLWGITNSGQPVQTLPNASSIIACQLIYLLSSVLNILITLRTNDIGEVIMQLPLVSRTIAHVWYD